MFTPLTQQPEEPSTVFAPDEERSAYRLTWWNRFLARERRRLSGIAARLTPAATPDLADPTHAFLDTLDHTPLHEIISMTPEEPVPPTADDPTRVSDPTQITPSGQDTATDPAPDDLLFPPPMTEQPLTPISPDRGVEQAFQ